MNKLSVELMEDISSRLSSEDLYQCLTVNKSWYLVTVPLLYATIKPRGYKYQKMFFESFLLNKRCTNAGVFIKELDMTFLLSGEQFSSHPVVEAEFIEVLHHCPNLEILSVSSQPSFVQGLLRTPDLKKLKELWFSQFCSNSQIVKEIMDCQYRFRSSLTSLNLMQVAGYYSLDNIITYVSSFSHLNRLKLRETIGLINVSVFDTILPRCSHLTHLTYHCSSLKTTSSIVNHSSIQSLKINMGDLCLQDIVYMKTAFPHLTELILTPYGNEDGGWDRILELILQIVTLTHFQMSFSVNYQESHAIFSICADLLFQTSSHKAVINEAVFKVSYNNNDRINLSFTKKHNTCRRTIVFEIQTTTSPVEKYLEKIGHHLDILHLDIEVSDSMIGCTSINVLCPRLSELYLANQSVLPSAPPNHNLKTLVLSEIEINRPLFRTIESAYPLLQKLTLTIKNGQMNEVTEDIYEIHLSNMQLKLLTVEWSFFLRSSMMVINDGYSVCGWHFNYSNTEKIVIKDKHDLNSALQFYTERLLLFRCKSVENVHFIMH
ncbi:hypothetical protein BDB01DRAFT_809995 [Pilobolus umbonatus]|nr:hypothetical protein BDB01DRAFT_809995 [Pilobolus umbonatus]